MLTKIAYCMVASYMEVHQASKLPAFHCAPVQALLPFYLSVSADRLSQAKRILEVLLTIPKLGAAGARGNQHFRFWVCPFLCLSLLV